MTTQTLTVRDKDDNTSNTIKYETLKNVHTTLEFPGQWS